MAQKASLLSHFLAGKTITQLEARQVYRIERLASRVEELRKDGHDIVAVMKTDETGHRYAEYSLVKRGKHGQRRKVA
ncbi:helix-turn-helix domain-containing protein [Inquilinus limosus]|uniref:helix-turn-helix domain-containing protein n=1 Tax=Inquilinus limosus TaxID=171674 RepID=UPI00041290E5|nr:helix-turn-helix domain-containing protein [Inquilinus limosus]